MAVIGSGFGGSLTALALRRQGRSVVMLERGRHPRFAIGESSTPLANLLLEELAERWDMPRLRPLCKWGSWRRAYPDLACGLKRGFSFFRHETGRPFADGPEHACQLLVAASPHDQIGDTIGTARRSTSSSRGGGGGRRHTPEETVVDGVQWSGDRGVLDGTRAGRSIQVRTSFVVDASGPRGFLQRALQLPEKPRSVMPPTQGLYTHFEGVARWDALVRGDAPPPYPVDDAAFTTYSTAAGSGCSASATASRARERH